MGLIGKLLGGGGAVTAVGDAVQGVAEVFTPSATRRMELSAQAQMAAMASMEAEFADAGSTWFDSLVNGLNRLPRPFLALGTVALFVYAMIDPMAFSQRMAGLNAVPEPLWWLLGAVVAFYFGARETHYFRESRNAAGRMVIPMAHLGPQSGFSAQPQSGAGAQPQSGAAAQPQSGAGAQPNPALADWQRTK